MVAPNPAMSLVNQAPKDDQCSIAGVFVNGTSDADKEPDEEVEAGEIAEEESVSVFHSKSQSSSSISAERPATISYARLR